jgi:hypothetical protein
LIIIDSQVSGGEGCFLIAISKSLTLNLGVGVALRFIITQHERDIELLELIKNFLNCGSIATAGNCKQVLVSNFQDINNIIIPLFAKHCVQGVKHEDYLDFCKAAELIKNKAHLTQEGLDKIIKLKSGMNRGREPGSLVVLET